MNSVKLDGQRGQILVTVALMAVALFAFVALAVDVGQIYGGRRQMQNAADAAAFAGAQQICFTEWTSITDAHDRAREAAIDYAVNRNRAFTATVEFSPDDYTVDVVASQVVDTFFAGIIGIGTADVHAEAAARCEGTYSAGGLWPLAFNYAVYTDTIDCDQKFFVFASQAKSDDFECAADCCDCESEVVINDECDFDKDCLGKLACDLHGHQAGSAHVSTAHRGWLLFPDPEDSYPDSSYCMGAHSCGEPRVECWLAEDHPGPIKVNDCIAGQPGVTSAVGQPPQSSAIGTRVGDQVAIILWDEVCDPGEDVLGTCPGTPYRVAGFGCVEVIGWEQAAKIPTCGGSPPHRNAHLVWAKKICDGDPGYEECFTTTGMGSGELPDDWELRAVRLTK